MIKKTSILLIILLSLLVCAFDSVYYSEVEVPETYQENEISENSAESGEEEIVEIGSDEITLPEDPAGQDAQPLYEGENQGGENNSESPEIMVQNNDLFGEPEPEPAEEPAAPAWMDIDEDQVDFLYALYSVMTDNGKNISGWFSADDYAPCTWNGITCEAGRVTGLTFEDAGFFTVFPEELLALRDLKELHMVNTLMRGPLPEKLFSALPKLEVLELKGNLLTGSIPPLPAAFEFYPMLREITISDNLDDEQKYFLLLTPEYMNVCDFTPDPLDYPEIDLTPGLDGNIPDNWNLLPLLTEIDLSGNELTGSVPGSFAWIPLSKLDLRDNAELFPISKELYDHFVSLDNPEINLEGIQKPEEEPVVNPVTEETPVPDMLPSNETLQSDPVTFDAQTLPTEVPEKTKKPKKPEKPTEKPEMNWTFIIEETVTPEPRYYTATPVPRFYPTATPYYYQPQPYYYYPTATPYYYQPQPYYYYPTETPYYYQPQPYYYPTATPYTNYNPYYVYPTATSAYQYPQYVQVRPTQTSTPVPTQNPSAMLGFTYKLEAMTGNNIPMTWRYTGMREYSINYLDASGNLYPAFAMEWTPASKVCNASACNATVSVPDDLLKQGKFSLQLRVRDAAGNIYMSDPVMMEVSFQQPTPTPMPEQPKSFLSGFFEWLFGPLIRLFGGK